MRLWSLFAVLVGLLLSAPNTAAQAPQSGENIYGPGVIGKLFELNPSPIIRNATPVAPAYTGYARDDSEFDIEIMEFEDAPMIEMQGMSDDGEIVVGRQFRHDGFPELDRSIVRWASFSGMMEIGGTNRGMGRPVISAAGNTVYGTIDPDEDEPWWLLAARWAPTTFDWTTWDLLNDLDHVPTPPEDWSTEANGLSQNGLHLVGLHYERGLWIPRPYHWTEEGDQGWVDLPVLDENEAWIVPNSVSDDGSIIVGGHSRLPTGAIFGIRWVDGEPEWILNQEGDYAGELLSCNSDCSFITGNAVGNLIYGSALAYRWTEDGGVQYLQPFEDAHEPSRYWASDITEDGSIIVGGYVYEIEVDGWFTDVVEGFIWFDDENGGTMHDLRTWLGYHGIDFFDDWRHVSATKISSDGRFILGSGNRVEGDNLVIRSWKIELPVNESHCLITSSLDFSNAIVGVANSIEAVVTNAGTGTCELTDASTSNDAFSIDFSSTTLVAGAHTRFDITFEAAESGNYEGELLFESPEGGFSGTMTANAQNPPVAVLGETELHFEITDDPNDSQTVVLHNQTLLGAARLEFEVTGIELVSEGDGLPGEEVVSVDPPEGIINAASQTNLEVAVVTSGLAFGTHIYEVTFATNDPETPELILTVVIAITTSGENNGDALSFELHPAYPNPFSGATAITFEIPNAEHVMIEVLDLTGRRVAVLVDEHMSGGAHEVRWDAADLASGAYLYRMRAGSFTQTLRATVVR